MIVEVPKKDRKDKIYALIDAGLQVFPLGGSATTLFKEIIDLPYDVKSKQWQNDVTRLVNKLSAIADKNDSFSMPLPSKLALSLLEHMLADCPNGMNENSYTSADFIQVFYDRNKDDIVEAAYELQALGLCKIRDVANYWGISITHEGYKRFDRLFMPWDTRNDILDILGEMINCEEYTSKVVCSNLGWSTRRFNPALTCVIENIPEKLLRNVNQWEYSVHALINSPETKAYLKKMLSDLTEDEQKN